MKLINTAIIVALFASAAAIHLRADNSSAHPYYLQALADLRIARWNVQQGPGNSQMNDDETKALSEINAEISAIKKASIDDNTSADNHPAADEALDHKGHLQRAMSLLGKIRQDLLNEHEDPSIPGLRKKSFNHLNKAIRFVGRAFIALGRHGH
jgi:hypothetical protein